MNFIRTIITLIYEPLFICGMISLAYICVIFYNVIMRILEDHDLEALNYIFDAIFSF